MSDGVMDIGKSDARTPPAPRPPRPGLWAMIASRLDTNQGLTVGFALGMLGWEAAWVMVSALIV